MAIGTEPNIVVNGVTLTTAEAMTVRVALGAFASNLQEGLGEDSSSDAIAAGYIGCIDRIHRIIQG